MMGGGEGSIGEVETKVVQVCPGGLTLESGRRLESVEVAYEQYGEMDAACDNVVLVCHALSGGAHAAGWHPGARKPGWWDNLIGPGKAFDTRKYCVICTNVLGSCYGTTGPSSAEPATGRPYGSRFPVVTVGDMVAVQKALLDRLGVPRLLAVAGGSMGGMQALQWAVSYPASVRSVIAIATSARHSPQQIAFNEIARRAVTADPAWSGGDYYGGERPDRGLAVARMIGHVTYLSAGGMERKFGRKAAPPRPAWTLEPEFEVERYLSHQGREFAGRFDPNSLLYLTRAIDYFDLGAKWPSLTEALRAARASLLLLTFSSDWLYPPSQLAAVGRAARDAGRAVEYHEIPSGYGHDAFLLEGETQTPIIGSWLERLAAAIPAAAPADAGAGEVEDFFLHDGRARRARWASSLP